MNHVKNTLFLLIATIAPVIAQVSEKPMTVDDLSSWKRITGQAISDDGRWVACQIEPWIGDASVHLYTAKGERIASFEPVEKPVFSYSCRYVLLTEKPPLREIDSLKLKKTKAEEMPMNKLLIYDLAGRKAERIDSLKSYKLSETADFMAYQRGGKADSALYIRTLEMGDTLVVPAVSAYGFAKKEAVLYFVTKGDSLGVKAGLYTYTPAGSAPRLIFEGDGVFSQVAFTEKGDKLAFLYAADKDSTAVNSALYLSENNLPAACVADKHQETFPEKWVVSENEGLRFSDNGERLFFGIAPMLKQKDTTLLDENRPKVEVWNWNEEVQYTQQKYDKEKDLKKAYTAVYKPDGKQFRPLATLDIPQLLTADKGDASVALLTTPRPYDLERMWTGRSRYDVYSVDMETGDRQLIKKALQAEVRLSPKGKYAYWYNPGDSSWYTYSLAAKEEYRLTTPASFPAWDEENDVPDYPSPYRLAGWTTDDAALLIYDRYDIWRFDPEGKTSPVNLTVNGREKHITYRYIQLDREETSIVPTSALLLKGFDERTKGSGYYSLPAAEPAAPKVLLAGDYMLNTPLKAKKADVVIYTSETFAQYPDVLLSDLSFKRSVRLTDGYKQQEDFRWGSAELVSWTSLDGKHLEGVVYKPDDFDPKKQYPLLVNFYERNAETLYSFHTPEPHRSTIDYHLYNSNGYIIFNPDVVYEDGYPGESCFNSVMPGISMLIAQGFVDEKAIGAQGHSWGGYQVAYLATRTNLFAAIESGAPVVNMFSAYGGIRWGSGLNRSFQYEHSQSRIGGTIWQMPLRYVENSPLFTMDKVQTPILIMHNDNDGHVPWYQGIEYFVALKRLQKPVWLLNYTGEVHWPMRMANRVDFQKRMFQFFEHYLRHQPMPQWMSEGIPAIDQDFELGY